MQMNEEKINMPLTLEKHFEELAELNPDVKNLHSLWILLKKDLIDELKNTRGIFVHFSLHDESHSRSVIRAIERFLGEERIRKLQATDTFMLLCCSYAHDYGMAMSFQQIYNALKDDDFINFLKKQEEFIEILDEEEREGVRILLSYVKEKRNDVPLHQIYFAIMVVVQMYLRPSHWKGVERVWEDFKGLLAGRLYGRFVQGGEGIIDICEAHGKDFSAVMKMGVRTDGITGDDFHPRFVAAMLRLGDLLDLDNGRFPRWFVTEVGKNESKIPHLSKLHFKKHEAITHLLITPKRIEICASCSGADGYEVAGVVREWIDWLENECYELIQNWSEIVQDNFGRPPRVSKAEILLDGKPYISQTQRLQMHMSQKRVMKLLEGTSIYQDRYVGIRELVQNAVDASLLQLWDDITHNRYRNIGVSKKGYKIKEEEIRDTDITGDEKELSFLEYKIKELKEIFENYSIMVELIENKVENKVYLVVKDQGTGITQQDIQYMADIGSSKEKNKRVMEIMKNMPRWLKPSGVFGIGLQSAFQLTNRIEFYTRRPNEPERLIAFNSYGHNHGKIEVREVEEDTKGIYNDNAIPGTNVKIAISLEKLLADTKGQEDEVQGALKYYDMEFDSNDTLHGVYVELSQIIQEKIGEYPFDYFNIYFQTMVLEDEDMPPVKEKKKRLRRSYFTPAFIKGDDSHKKQLNRNTVREFYQKSDEEGEKFSFTDNIANYYDEETARIYRLQVREGEVTKFDEKNCIRLPQPVRDLYHFQYKFSPIQNADTVYPLSVRGMRNVHAGFLEWNINILDDSTEKYLNIDRDRLREGAIMESELDQVRKSVLQKWCEHLIEKYRNAENARITKEAQAKAKLAIEGKEDSFIPEKSVNRYIQNPLTLVSLTLLFFQNVPNNKFREFVEPYSEFLKSKEYMLEGENYPVEKLWEEGRSFRYSFPIPMEWREKYQNLATKDFQNVLEIHLETIKKLPHKMFHITEIVRDTDHQLNYCLNLGYTDSEDFAIKMDDIARLYDYSRAIEPDVSRKTDINVDSLVRKVFKPDQEYYNLIVEKYPKRFRRGENFSSALDYCIHCYILSPFDRELTKWLNKMIQGKIKTTDVDSEIYTTILKHADESEQMKKCIRYVYKQHEARAAGKKENLPDDLEEIIRRDYIDFLKNFCKVLIDNSELIKNQFKTEVPISIE